MPHVIILAGPNGAGKSTSAPSLLRDTFGVDEFVNADTIAAGLSAFAPDAAGLEAGKIMLRRLRDLAARQVNFAFETTLATRSFAPWLLRLQETGYRVHLLFLTLPDAEFARQRVAGRVRLGGHAIDGEVIRRRFAAGLRNLFRLYMPAVTAWRLLGNAVPGAPEEIAAGSGETLTVSDPETYSALRERYGNG